MKKENQITLSIFWKNPNTKKNSSHQSKEKESEPKL